MTTRELTYGQHAIWFTEQAGAANGAFAMALGIWFGPGLDETALRVACETVVARHWALRAGVRLVDGMPRLVEVQPPPALRTATLTDEAARAAVSDPVDLTGGPLTRLVLLRGTDRHLLVIATHHLVFDGMSKDILARELADAYRAAPGRAAVAPAAVGAGMGDDAPPDLAGARGYWAAHWSPPPPPVLPGLRGVPASTPAGAQVEFTIDHPGIDHAARRLGVSRFELVLSVIHAVLGRYGNVGAPVAVSVSARRPAEEGTIGSFANELPIRVARPSGTLGQYARELRVRLREAYAFRRVHLGQVVSGLRPAVTLTPISVGYRRRASEPVFAGVASRVEWMLFNGAARNALHIQLVDSGADIAVSLQHDPALLPTEAVQRIGAHLRTALVWAVAEPAHPDRPLWQLELLPAEERAQLAAWNATTRDYPATATVLTLFAEQVARSPGALAATDGRRGVSYAELDRLVTAFSGRLADRGIRRGDRVALSLPRSLESLVALLGTMRAGAAYVPVDPTYPEARQNLIIEDAAATLVVTTLALDELATQPAPRDCGLPGPGPEDTAYLMYTSGSTGRPKGVVIPHRGLANELLAMRDALGGRASDRWLALASLSFDISVLELLLPLTTGGTTAIAAGRSALDGPGVVAFIAENAVTHVQATPSGWRILLDAGFGAQGGTGHIAALVGGEALPAPLAARLRPRVSRLTNVYGPTETTVWATLDDVPAPAERITVGRPIANLRAHVLDGELRPVPVGLTGEICIAGAGMADGYLGRPGLTADRFVPDPYGPAGSRLYRTGDIGHWDADGRLVCRGRGDNQVKLRGNRIELGEIEAHLATAPGVAAAAVTLRGEGADALLVGYVVARSGATRTAPEPAALREHLARHLTAVMIPTAWVFLDALPLSPNGKIDRRALPDPPEPFERRERTGFDNVNENVTETDTDDVVSRLRMIWEEVLQVPEIGIYEDLFDLGGHSLTITRINGRVQEQFGIELPLDAYFDTPTIAEIAEVVRQTAHTHGLVIGGQR
jgi:amino acid adenylation domain-containing protein